MLATKLYYFLKPFLPRTARLSARKLRAKHLLKSIGGEWPIFPHSEKRPAQWPGWPDGKKFAVVLTHDVEGPAGIAKCPDLQRLEERLGFKSSFNFIPEGDYRVSSELRQSLVTSGFEVGVHDLRHDGKLFSGLNSFKESAKKVNDYLERWGAVGFRAGFMLRNLGWYHQLNVLYDASTFDTDPFEPQPGGMRTIFPLWLDDPDAKQADPSLPKGYVELPYTLPQDSTLFLVLGETSPKIWIDKLRWIAEHGGMVLLNIHPDYIRFSEKDRERYLFPSAYYTEFLQYIRENYAGQYWNPLPKELASWYKQKHIQTQTLPGGTQQGQLAGPLRKRRVAVILCSSFPGDPRPQRAAETLVQEGAEVDMFCLGTELSPPEGQIINGVRVFYYVMARSRDNKLVYFYQYGRFLLAALWFLTKRSIRRKYDLVHVHNMPDVLVFTAIVPKLRGAKIILDLHDPMPELMTTIFGVSPSHFVVRLLHCFERWSIRFSNLVLTPNLAFKRLFVSRGCPSKNIQIVMNSPEEQIFDPAIYPRSRRTGREGGTFKIMHHGSIVHRHGVDMLVDAVAALRPKIPGVQLDIYGSHTPFLDKVMKHAEELGVNDIVHYRGGKSLVEIAQAIQECDLGVVPNRKSSFTDINFPTRIFEYLAMERLVLAPATEGISDYFSTQQLVMFEPGNLDALTAKILWVWEHPQEASVILERGMEVYRSNLWRQQRSVFIQHAASLFH